MSDTYLPKVYLLIEWPHSARVLNHPQAKLLDIFEMQIRNIREGRDCIVPREVWEEYKDSQYIDLTNERNMVIKRDNEE